MEAGTIELVEESKQLDDEPKCTMAHSLSNGGRQGQHKPGPCLVKATHKAQRACAVSDDIDLLCDNAAAYLRWGIAESVLDPRNYCNQCGRPVYQCWSVVPL